MAGEKQKDTPRRLHSIELCCKTEIHWGRTVSTKFALFFFSTLHLSSSRNLSQLWFVWLMCGNFWIQNRLSCDCVIEQVLIKQEKLADGKQNRKIIFMSFIINSWARRLSWIVGWSLPSSFGVNHFTAPCFKSFQSSLFLPLALIII